MPSVAYFLEGLLVSRLVHWCWKFVNHWCSETKCLAECEGAGWWLRTIWLERRLKVTEIGETKITVSQGVSGKRICWPWPWSIRHRMSGPREFSAQVSSFLFAEVSWICSHQNATAHLVSIKIHLAKTQTASQNLKIFATRAEIFQMTSHVADSLQLKTESGTSDYVQSRQAELKDGWVGVDFYKASCFWWSLPLAASLKPDWWPKTFSELCTEKLSYRHQVVEICKRSLFFKHSNTNNSFPQQQNGIPSLLLGNFPP